MRLRNFFSLKQIGALRGGAKQPHHDKYRHFRALLNHNRDALRHMAELEQLYYSDHPIDARTVEGHHTQLRSHVQGLVAALNALTDDRFAALTESCRVIDVEIAGALPPQTNDPRTDDVLSLADIGTNLSASIGGKAAGLALMKNVLHLPVPEGFVITAGATERFLATDGLQDRIRAELARLSPEDLAGLQEGSERIRAWIRAAPLPEALSRAIHAAYAALEARTGKGIRIAVRSSAVGEDGEASFAGQYSTVLNVTGDDLLAAFKRVVASKYSPRATSYRQLLGLDDADTPMCVLGLAMVDAKASGVMYSLDPETLDERHVKISSLWGLGEQLVGGDATPDAFLVEKQTGDVVARRIARKPATLIPLAMGGTRLEVTQAVRQTLPSLDEAALRQLCASAVRIEAQAGCAQDIEWAIDAADRLYFLQARPLHLAPQAAPAPDDDLAGLDLLLSDGIAASRGIAAGKVHVARDEGALSAIPDQAILVTRTAAPAYAAVMGRIAALVTDVGSITSHLASVAREFGIPAIMGAGNATSILAPGDEVTVVAGNRVAVVSGAPDRWRERMRPARKRYVGSPAHRKLRTLLDHVVPLNLTDSRSADFAPGGCRSYHDVIRFCHEHAMRAMFDLSSDADGTGAAVKVKTHLPLALHVIDLGGGLQAAHAARRTIAPEDFASVPLLAIWKGLSHPGISWEGTINFASSRFMSIMASIATSELGPEPGGDSYALASHDYLNFSAKFGYHFATIDALCGDEASHNYVSMQFAGGAGNYFGRSLRIRFLGTVLERLGFRITLQGDLIEASFSRHDRDSTRDRLDQMGRLLATSRLLDLTLSNEEDVSRLAAAFMAGDYEFLKPHDPAQPANFYTQHGHWECREREGHKRLHQSGNSGKRPVAGALSGLIGKTLGASYQELLDSIGAYFYFPLAIAKNSETGDGRIAVAILPEDGRIDRAGGLVFGLRNAANYFVFRINALENNAILFEYVNGKRTERASVDHPLQSDRWYRLAVEIEVRHVRCRLDDEAVIDYMASAPVRGYVGVWTKADSATWFGDIVVTDAMGTRIFGN